jgi:hypothetical protein
MQSKMIFIDIKKYRLKSKSIDEPFRIFRIVVDNNSVNERIHGHDIFFSKRIDKNKQCNVVAFKMNFIIDLRHTRICLVVCSNRAKQLGSIQPTACSWIRVNSNRGRKGTVLHS